MNISEWAELLDGREYLKELNKKDADQAKIDKVVIVLGRSDDLMEFYGAINDELDCYEGTTVKITQSGVLETSCDNIDCPYFQEVWNKCQTEIKAIWDKDGYSWIFCTNIPHRTFDIMEGNEKYCRGIVFNLIDIKE